MPPVFPEHVWVDRTYRRDEEGGFDLVKDWYIRMIGEGGQLSVQGPELCSTLKLDYLSRYDIDYSFFLVRDIGEKRTYALLLNLSEEERLRAKKFFSEQPPIVERAKVAPPAAAN